MTKIKKEIPTPLHPPQHRFSLSMWLWHWQHWPGHQYITIVSIFVGFALAALTTSPLFIKPHETDTGIKVPTNSDITNDSFVDESETIRYFRYLDGVEVSSDNENNRWPVGVMIENLVSVRPQWGLSDASVIYETLAESGVTRFLVVFDGPGHDLTKIGPVRSARPYYLEWISEYDGLYAHAGGSPQALQAISGLGIKAINGIAGGSQYFWRDTSISAPHNLFTNSDHLGRAMNAFGLLDTKPQYRPSLFKDDVPLAERPTEARVNPTINFSSVSYQVHYEYDPDRNSYRRFNGNTQQVDALNNEPLRAHNIVVIRVPAEYNLGEKGRIEMNVTGEGQLLVFRDGIVIAGTWKKQSRDFRTEYYDADGKEIYLNRGQTWVEVVPGDRSVTY